MADIMHSGRVLITGAAGFIGSRLVSRLMALDFECLGLDNLSTGCSPLVPRKNLEFFVLDICDHVRVARIFNDFRPEIVVHLAAIHHIPMCEEDPSKALYVNVVGTQNVLEASSSSGTSRVILASTGGVYDWSEGPLAEDAPVRPTDVYTLSKTTNERQLALWIAKTDRAGIVARIFNTIGKNDLNGHLIPDILRHFKSNGGPRVIKLGNLHTRRDYIYVDDTAECLARMVGIRDLTKLETFNIGTGTEHDVRSIVECISHIKRCPVECVSDPSRVRRVDRRSQLADITKASRVLGWKPRYTFEEALSLTVTGEG